MDKIKINCFLTNKGKIPTYAHDTDACCDVYVDSIVYDTEYDRYVIHTGLYVDIPKGYEITIRPRSSLTKTEFYIPNTPCTIDSGYKGEIMIIYKNRTHNKLINALLAIKSMLFSLSDKVDDNITYLAKYRQFADMLDNIADDEKLPFKVGDRIGQISIAETIKIEWNVVNNIDEIGDSERGDGGFGSTGK